MFVIQITGGRDFTDANAIYNTMKPYVDKYGADNIIVRHGNAVGADLISHEQAVKLGITNIQRRAVTKADWKKYGKAAGNLRNIAMLDEAPYPNIVLAFPGPNSRGTYHMIRFAKDRGIETIVWEG